MVISSAVTGPPVMVAEFTTNHLGTSTCCCAWLTPRSTRAAI